MNDVKQSATEILNLIKQAQVKLDRTMQEFGVKQIVKTKDGALLRRLRQIIEDALSDATRTTRNIGKENRQIDPEENKPDEKTRGLKGSGTGHPQRIFGRNR
jgi:hypothetical protein